MNRTKRNKPKNKKKNSVKRKSPKSKHRPKSVTQDLDPITSAVDDDFQLPLNSKKAKKRKHSFQVEYAQAEETNVHDGVSQEKKKKVTWGKNSTKIIPVSKYVKVSKLFTSNVNKGLAYRCLFIKFCGFTSTSGEITVAGTKDQGIPLFENRLPT